MVRLRCEGVPASYIEEHLAAAVCYAREHKTQPRFVLVRWWREDRLKRGPINPQTRVWRDSGRLYRAE